MGKTVKMTEGGIPGQLLSYAMPLILGNFFQLTYNVVDSMIVGRFIGKDTLAAVGTAGPVMNIFILGISGVSMGAAVLMSRFFGAGDGKRLREEVKTKNLFITDKYGAYLGKEFLTPARLDALMDIMQNGVAVNLSEAMDEYRKQHA